MLAAAEPPPAQPAGKGSKGSANGKSNGSQNGNWSNPATGEEPEFKDGEGEHMMADYGEWLIMVGPSWLWCLIMAEDGCFVGFFDVSLSLTPGKSTV